MQYGRRVTDGAHKPPPGTPPDERFDALGSWLAVFGLSAVACTLLCYAVACVVEHRAGRPSPPSLHLRVMLFAGSGAGIFWSIANVFVTLAVLRGGNAVTLAQANASGLIVSGLWGVLYYREIRGWPLCGWVVSAAFTAAMGVMLGFEKGK